MDIQPKDKSLLVVDVSHLAFLYDNITQELTARYGGQVVDTRIASNILKSLWRWSKHGVDDVVVCFDSSIPSRREFIQKTFGCKYKPNRHHRYTIRLGLDLTYELLKIGNVSTLKCDDYEADDLIGATVSYLHDKYKHINVVTGDFDLVPLVDDKVSVFLRSHKIDSGNPAFRKYYELTPESYSKIPEVWSKCKGWYIPYNTMLLYKMTFGDESDGIPGITYETASGSQRRVYPKSKFGDLVEKMIADDVDISNIFRFGDSVPEDMLTVVKDEMGEEFVQPVLDRYQAMNLNQGYSTRGVFRCHGMPTNLSKDFVKAAAEIDTHIV